MVEIAVRMRGEFAAGDPIKVMSLGT